MTIEQKLQDYILDKYKSVMQFAKLVDLPYTTVKGIFSRGIWGTSIQNVTKICNFLSIDINALINGEIKEQIHIDKLSDHEKKVILAVDRLLGVEDEILIPTIKAARSDGNNQPIEIVNLPDLSKFEPDDTDL